MDNTITKTRTRTTVIKASGLVKSFGTTRVLNGIDLSVRAGEFLVVMGASGSGKSTLLHCLGGLDSLSAGSVDIAGRELSGMREKELSRLRLTQLGFIFQQAHFLVNLNIRDNILLPGLKAEPGDRAAVVARAVELMGKLGIDHIAGNAITEVSGGQLQRAAICRGLIARPAVLFADEPTGALNSTMSREVMDALSAVHESGTSIVMVTHDRSCAARGDRVIYLRDGCVVAEMQPGTWTADEQSGREAKLTAWLDRQGF